MACSTHIQPAAIIGNRLANKFVTAKNGRLTLPYLALCSYFFRNRTLLSAISE